MIHLGDITKINGAAVDPVYVIIGGSPCQDLSVAGNQKGIQHADNGDEETTRSGLFMEQLRIIKEMRRNDIEHGRTGVDTRPRFMVWENVPGAFSSNKGADFATVLGETIKVVCEKAPVVPMPKRGWPYAGCLSDMGGQWSLAWRVFDAQFWGVPQRRKRITLVADFGGFAAPEILFEREGVSGDIEPGNQAGESAAGTATRGVDAEAQHGEDIGIDCLTPWDTQSSRVYSDQGMWPTLSANGMDAVLFSSKAKVWDTRGNGNGLNAPTVTCGNNNRVTAYTAVTSWPDKARTLTARYDSSSCIDRGQNIVCASFKSFGEYAESTTSKSLLARDDITTGDLIYDKALARRLTPLECERLQGFPDGWTDIGAWVDEKGKKRPESSDTARYKALGNSIALPPWGYVLHRLAICCGADVTMASLFDGIGGFPLIWERLNGTGTCLWASEIDDFPIAVTKRRFSINLSATRGDEM